MPPRLREAETAYTRPTAALVPGLERTNSGPGSGPTSPTQTCGEVLAHAPAPRIINIHGGVYRGSFPTWSPSRNFSSAWAIRPASLTNPNDGTYSFSCYESSEKIAGVIAWYYEQEGLRPMMVGHSQGGMQAVKVLGQFAASLPRPAAGMESA